MKHEVAILRSEHEKLKEGRKDTKKELKIKAKYYQEIHKRLERDITEMRKVFSNTEKIRMDSKYEEKVHVIEAHLERAFKILA